MISIGVAMDAFVVAATYGIMLNRLKAKQAFKVALFFGFFQGIMPILGYYLGNYFKGYVQHIATWLAGGILFIIGAKMIYETLKEDHKSNCKECPFAKTDSCPELKEKIKKKMGNATIIMLALATSIDALGVGISFSLLGDPILMASIMIGVITFILCLIGVIAGNKISNFSERVFTILGGIILIIISIKIVIQ